MKRDKYDALFSDLVRIRSLACERCGIEYPDFPDVRDRSFHCSHYIGRIWKATRYHPDNAFALCAACHKEVGDDPGAHYKFAFEKLGEERYEALRVRKHTQIKWGKPFMKELYKHYKSEYDRLVELRNQGVTGRLEFTWVE